MSDSASYLKKLFWESLLATLLVMAVMWVFFSLFAINFKPLNYLSAAVKNIHLTDIYFSNLKNDEVDTTIVLVNIAELDRSGIASVMETLNSAEPKVIALDVLFADRTDSTGDPLLEAAFEKAKSRLVLAGFYDERQNSFNRGYKSFPGIKYGHANLITNEARTEVVRSFHPSYQHHSGEIHALAAATAQMANSESFASLLRREKHEELINYKGDKNTFRILQPEEVMNVPVEQLSFLKDKIVMVGFLGAGQHSVLDDLSDLFYTPVNKDFYGRSHPDMYGLVIHANILSMTLSGSYITEFPNWLLLALSFAAVYLHVVPFAFYFVKKHLWYHVFAKLFQLFSMLVILLLVFFLFKNTFILFNTKYFLLGIFLAVDVLYLYEALAVLAFRKLKWRSFFVEEH